MNLQEHIRKVLKEETGFKYVLYDLLNMLFPGFDEISYDWAEFNCGMGVCCDPFAIGFTLPESDYNDYLFKLVDIENYWNDGSYGEEITRELPEVCYEQPDIKNPNFNAIVFFGGYAEEVDMYLGSEENWKNDFLKIVNQMFGSNANRIIII